MREYTVYYRASNGWFYFTPFIKGKEKAMAYAVNLLWEGCKAFHVEDCVTREIVFETKEPVYHSMDNPNPTPELPF